MLGYLFLLETYHALLPFLLLDQTSILEKQPLLLPSLICRRWQPYQTDDTFSMQSSPPNISHPLPPLAAKSPILLVACRCRGDALSLENAKVMIYEASFVGSPNFSCCLLRLSIVEFYLLHHILVPKSNTVFSTSTTSLRYHLAVPLSCIFWVTKKAHNYLLILHIQGRRCDQL